MITITDDLLIIKEHNEPNKFCVYKDLVRHHDECVTILDSVTVGGLFMGAIWPRIELWSMLTGEYHLESVIKYMMEHRASNKISEVVVEFYGQSDTFDNSKTEFIDDSDKMIWKKIKPKKVVYHTEFMFVSDVSGRIKGKKDRYAVDFCKPTDYKNAKITVAKDFTLYKNDYTSFHENGSRKRTKSLDHKGTNLGVYKPTVLEVVKAMAYEFTFHGNPAHTARRMESVKSDFDDVKNGKANTKEIIFK